MRRRRGSGSNGIDFMATGITRFILRAGLHIVPNEPRAAVKWSHDNARRVGSIWWLAGVMSRQHR